MQLSRFKATNCFLVLLVLVFGCNPPPIVDASASDLDVTITVLDISRPAKDVPVTIQFLQNGTLIQFESNTRVYCDGVELTFNGLAYVGRVPRHGASDSYVFSYTHNDGAEVINVIARESPFITSPVVNEVIDRANILTIAYISESSAGVRGSASDSTNAIGGNPNFQPDNGIYNEINISSLKAGPGSIRLTREYTGVISGTNFKSVEYTYDSATDIIVTFK